MREQGEQRVSPEQEKTGALGIQEMVALEDAGIGKQETRTPNGTSLKKIVRAITLSAAAFLAIESARAQETRGGMSNNPPTATEKLNALDQQIKELEAKEEEIRRAENEALQARRDIEIETWLKAINAPGVTVKVHKLYRNLTEEFDVLNKGEVIGHVQSNGIKFSVDEFTEKIAIILEQHHVDSRPSAEAKVIPVSIDANTQREFDEQGLKMHKNGIYAVDGMDLQFDDNTLRVEITTAPQHGIFLRLYNKKGPNQQVLLEHGKVSALFEF